MSVATETTRCFVDLWQRETVLRRKQIVIEAPTDVDMARLGRLDGEELARLANMSEWDADWEVEEVEPHEIDSDIDISSPVPDERTADIVFVRDEGGGLVDADSGERASFLD